MIALGSPIYLVCGWTDMRKNINGLAYLVENELCQLSTSGAWFVFCGKSRDRLKILFWDRNGFWLFSRRLEQGKFHWPLHKDDPILTVSKQQLYHLLTGLKWQENKGHKSIENPRIY